jgi:hypothetical protein
LQSAVAYVRSALAAELEARRRADHLVAGLMERLPELAASVEDAAVSETLAPTASEQRTQFCSVPAGAPLTLRAWIRRLLGR